MRRTSYRSYLLLILTLFGLMSLPDRASEKLRSIVICSISPCWQALHFLKEQGGLLLTVPVRGVSVPAHLTQQEMDQLRQENLLLHSQIENVREWLLFEDRIQEQMQRLRIIDSQQNAQADLERKEFFQRRSQELSMSLDLQLQSLPAKVIFREPSSWSSSVWINVGEKQNRALGKQVVAKNSPVLVGSSIVGVVEAVGLCQSRIRLITDARLMPSVRAIRGGEQDRYLLEHLDSLLFALGAREDLATDPEEVAALISHLSLLKKRLESRSGESYLAKGELFGSSHPLWRMRGQVLQGIGFNYDFTDREGPARDLRSGVCYSAAQKESGSILRAGDLLITTGLDGVFPAGFRVAVVSKVKQLVEGASSYEIEALPTAGNLDTLSQVFVLPPLGFEPP